MDDNEDENNFSDDDFDALPDNALFELEQTALRSTQNPQALGDPRSDTNIQNVLAQVSSRNVRANLAAQPYETSHIFQAQPYGPHENRPFSRDGFDVADLSDANVSTPIEEKESFVPRRVSGEVALRQQWRRERLGKSGVQANQKATQIPQKQVNPNHQQFLEEGSRYPSQGHEVDVEESMLVNRKQNPPNYVSTSAQEAVLRAQIEELIRQREELAKELESTKSAIMTQKGEIAIIRANQIKESKIHDRQLSTLKKTLQDEAAKYQASIEAITEQAQKISTDNKFLKQDLVEEVNRNRALQRNSKEKQPTENSITTPKKTAEHSLRDGFDDDEIMAVSPVKSGKRSKGGTPTAAGKRKRKVDVRSPPIQPLVLRLSNAPSQIPDPTEVEEAQMAEGPAPMIRKDPVAENNLTFMQKILNHRVSGGKERLIEALMQYAFPSETSKTFTSTILEATSRLSGARLPADLLQVFIELWSKSLNEKYYPCISLLIDIVNFAISLESSVVDADTIKILIPVLQASGAINGTVRFNHSPVSNKNFGQLVQTPQSVLHHEVNATSCLEMLLGIACSCLGQDDKLRVFWETLESHFVLMMLNSSQPVSDITLMLNLLSTSILPTTFGSICSSDIEQQRMESYIIDRVCYLLWESPRVDEGVKPYSKREVCSLRLEAIDLLCRLGLGSPTHPHDDDKQHGSLLLANHPAAIARIIRSIYDEVDTMYLHDLTHELHAEIINQGVRLLHRLLQLHGDVIDMQEKLTAINGGVHKHRVVLTRLAFSEGFYLDAGITNETVAMATDMLEEAVTPEEAEALLEAFPSYIARRGSTQG